MFNHVTKFLPTRLENLPARHAVFALAGLFVGGFVVYVSVYGPTISVSNNANSTEAQTKQGTSTPYVLPESEPTQLRIPSVGIEADFEESLGLQDNGEIEVPERYDTVGWYQYGPTPGELGPAVVLGHVDSYEGPEIFYDLREVAVGDEVVIERADGSTAIFEVTRIEEHAQSGFPTEKVYGDIDHAGLRLITCSGTYDHGTERYSHNLIVFAELVAPDTGTMATSTEPE